MKLSNFLQPSFLQKAAGNLLGPSGAAGSPASEGSKGVDIAGIVSDVSKAVQTVGSIVQALAPIASALLPLLGVSGSRAGLLPPPGEALGKGGLGAHPTPARSPFGGGGFGRWNPSISTKPKAPFVPSLPTHFTPSRLQGPDIVKGGRLRFEESRFDQGKELAKIGSIVDLMKMTSPDQIRALGMDPARIGEVERTVEQGVCQTLSLKWLKRQIKHPGKELDADDNMARLRKSMFKVTDLQSRIPELSPNPMQSAEQKFGLDPDRALINFGQPQVGAGQFADAIKHSDGGDFLYRFNFPEGHRYAGSSHAIAFSNDGRYVKAFEPNKGEFKIPKSEFKEWFGDLRAKYGLEDSQLGDELIPYTLHDE